MNTAMVITVNGEEREVPAGASVAQVAGERDGCAVAVNGEVVPRLDHDRVLAAGDRVEIVRAVQGG